jgi:hypothetical protein
MSERTTKENTGTTGPADATRYPSAEEVGQKVRAVMRGDYSAAVGAPQQASSEYRNPAGPSDAGSPYERIHDNNHAYEAAIRGADAGSHETLRLALTALDGLLDGQKNCGDYDAECPMQDAGKPWHDVQIAREAIIKQLAASASAPAAPREVGGAAPTSTPLDAQQEKTKMSDCNGNTASGGVTNKSTPEEQ